MTFSRPRRWWLPLIPSVGLVLVGLIPPLLVLAGLSTFTFVPGNRPQPDLTLENYVRFFTSPLYLGILVRSTLLAIGAAILTVVIAYPLAVILVRSNRGRLLILPIVSLSFFVSAIVLLTGWLAILGRRGMLNALLTAVGLEPISILYNELAVLIGLAAFTIPFAVFILVAALNNVDPSLEQAAQNLGATVARTFLRVTVPLTRPGLIAALVLSFSLSISAVLTPLILGGGRVQMIASSVYDSILVAANYPFAAAQVVLLLVVILTLTSSIGRVGSGQTSS
jgi:putative spermidine/putrescine transport system permease protein